MTDTKLPAWPSLPQGPNAIALRDYERARADAWEARCRVAVEALQYIASEDVPTDYPNEYGGIYGPRAAIALAAIGPLPLPQMPTPLPGEGE